MKIYVRALSLILFLSVTANGQKGWFWRNPAPQGNTLHAVKFHSINLAFAVGKKGTILQTNNGGSFWNPLFSDAEEDLYDIIVFNPDTAMAVGTNGMFLRTYDGGNNWQRLSTPTTVTLYSIFAFDQNSIIVVGANGVILRTFDGGDHWTLCDSKTSADLYAVTANHIGFLFAVGKNGVMVRSRDGGDHWELRGNLSSTTLHSLVIRNDKVGLAVGENGKIFRTITGDSIWLPITQTITNQHLRKVILNEDSKALIIGDNGILLKSDDSGQTWSAGVSGTTKNLYGISMMGSRGITVGADGTIMTSGDGGGVWQPQLMSVTSAKLRGIHVASPLVCTAVGDSAGKGIILRSDNGGVSWRIQNRTPNCIFEDLFFTHPDSGFVVGSAGNVWRTTNGGISWSKVITLPADYQLKNLYGIHFSTSRIGTIVGSSGAIWRTLDGGQTWSSQTNPFAMAPLLSVYFTHPDTGFAVGYFGTILRTTDGGSTWTRLTNLPIGTNIILTSIAFADADTGIAVGQEATVLRSTDKGMTWKKLTLPGLSETPLLENVFFANSEIGYIVGANGYVFRTTDGGATWNKQLRTTTNSLNAVCFLDPYFGMAAGDQGTILRTYDGGLPVELASFTGRYYVQDHCVILKWETVSETNNYGFEVQRKIQDTWEKIGFVTGHGTTTMPKNYTFRDDLSPTMLPNRIYYRLKQLDLDGAFSYSPIIEIKTINSMKSFVLHQNYPNPFNSQTTLRFYLSSPSHVCLQIFNVKGELLDTLVDKVEMAGEHAVTWKAKGCAAGVYFASLRADGFSQSKKLLYLP